MTRGMSQYLTTSLHGTGTLRTYSSVLYSCMQAKGASRTQAAALVRTISRWLDIALTNGEGVLFVRNPESYMVVAVGPWSSSG